MMRPIYLGLGSNVGDKLQYIQYAEQLINSSIGKIANKSEYYESDPWGNPDQDSFINSVLLVKTNDTPSEVFIKIKEIEKSLGRIQREKWGPREIDIDIIFYDNWIVNRSYLQIPHPSLHLRNFVLAPLLDIDKNLIHPKLNKPIEEFYLHSPDHMKILKLESKL